MLRLLVALLVLANLLFWVWARGWLAPMWPPPRYAEREPERVQAQLHPERVQVLVPAAPVAPVPAVAAALPATPSANRVESAASAASPLAPLGSLVSAICLEAGPFLPSELAPAEAALGAAGVASAAWVKVSEPGAVNATTLLRLSLTDADQAARVQAQAGVLAGRVRACGLGR
jgi:hypothetical protein